MTFRKSTLRLIPKAMIVTAMIATLFACGDPKAQPVPIIVTFNPNYLPPATLNTGAYAGIAADVANDNKNAGVGFSCTPAEACGSFTPTGAGSTIPVCYLAPDAVPPGNTVTVTATSRTDATKSVSATITIMNGAPNPCPP